MSSPFTSRVPAIIPFSFTTDSSGNATVKLRPRAAFWWSGKAVGKLSSGSAIWEVLAGGVIPVGFGRGQRAEIAGLMIAPGDTVQLNVINGPPNTTGMGSLVGEQGPTMQDSVAGFSSHPNTIAIDSATPSVVIDRIDTAAGSGNKVYPIPAGTVSIGFGVDADVAPPPPGTINRGVIPTQVILRGYPTGFNYILANLAQLQVTNQLAALVDPRDTQFSIAWTVAGANPLNDFIDVFVSPTNLAQQFDAIGNLLISEQLATPALWQSPQLSASLGETATGGFTLVPGVAGQIIRVFGWSLSSDGIGASGTRTHIIPHGGTTNVIAWLSAGGGAGGVGAVAGYAGGIPLAAGVALDFVVDFLAGGNSANAAVTYSQG